MSDKDWFGLFLAVFGGVMYLCAFVVLAKWSLDNLADMERDIAEQEKKLKKWRERIDRAKL